MTEDITPTPPLKRQKTELKQETSPFSFAPSVYSVTLADFIDYPTAQSFRVASKPTHLAMQKKFSESKVELERINQRLDELQNFKNVNNVLDEIMELVFIAPNQPVEIFSRAVEILYPNFLEIARNDVFQENARFKHWKHLIEENISFIDEIETSSRRQQISSKLKELMAIVNIALSSQVLTKEEKTACLMLLLPAVFQTNRYFSAYVFSQQLGGFSEKIENKEVITWLREKQLDFENAIKSLQEKNGNAETISKLNFLVNSIKSIIKNEMDISWSQSW